MDYLENIKKFRHQKGLSQSDMAERLGLAQNNYGKIERGETELTISRLDKISEILGVSKFTLLDGDDRAELMQGKIDAFENKLEVSDRQFSQIVEKYELQKELIESLKAQLKDKERIIELYENKK